MRDDSWKKKLLDDRLKSRSFIWSHKRSYRGASRLLISLSSLYLFYFRREKFQNVRKQLPRFASKKGALYGFSLVSSRFGYVLLVPLFLSFFLWPLLLFPSVKKTENIVYLDDNISLEFVITKEEQDQLKNGFSSVNDKDLFSKSLSRVEYPLGWETSSQYRDWYSIEVKAGETLQTVLMEVGFSSQDSRDIISRINPYFRVTRLREGQNLQIIQNENLLPIAFNLILNKEDVLHISPNREGLYDVNTLSHNLISTPRHIKGTIENSLYKDALSVGASNNAILEMMQLLSYDIDFQRDIQIGDRFEMIFLEDKTIAGELVDDSHVLYVKLFLSSRDKDYEFFNYMKFDGESNYYDENGASVRRQLLKVPVNGAYISSVYGVRVHPILGYRKAHKGIDFAVRKGTPVYSTGSGEVLVAGWSDVYGNYMKIRHLNGYDTLYAHMQGFARSVRSGVHVDQGQTIGYVGSTGQSTGPHLHYEVWRWGKRVNPSTVVFPSSTKLLGQEKELFLIKAQALHESLLDV